MNRRLQRFAALLGALAAVAFLVVTWAGNSGSTYAGQPVPLSPTPSATPTPSPPDADLAATFAQQGSVEAAAGAYLAVVEQGTPDERLAARLALAKLYLADDEPALAAAQLEAYLFEAPAEADVRAAQYLLAQALARQGDLESALPLYDAYITSGGGASLYARLDRAEALLQLGRYGAAVEEGELLRGEDLPSSVRLPFLLEMAQGLEASRPREALKYYKPLSAESTSPADQALALWRSALIASGGNDGLLLDPWLEIIQRFPETQTAQEIIDTPPVVKALIPLDGYYTGLVYFRAGRSAEARAAFEGSLAADGGGRTDKSLPARSAYYLAILDERAGNTDAAIAGYGRVLDLDPRVEQADDALWWQAQLLEQSGRRDGAVASYERLVSEFPTSDRAASARFRLALFPYDDGRYRDAADAFAKVARDTEDREQRRALLWEGKALAAAGEGETAEETWRTLRRLAPDSYYSLRAAVLLGGAGDDIAGAALAEPLEPDWGAIEAWLRETAGADPAGAFDALLYDQHWGLGQELLALGMMRRASAEFGVVLETADDDPGALYQAARFFDSVGEADLAARAATRMLSAVPHAVAEDAPDDLWRLAYPAPYTDVVRTVTEAEGVPDLLLLAMVRQESFFDPLAGSPAGALGLTQVIAPTGEAIAEDLGVTDFEVGDLFFPAVSLRFGAHYIGQQLDAFDGNVYHALAAYNGGPDNAQRWRDAAGGDVDRFVEEITFPETREYVRIVAENLARYREVYLGLEGPALPGE